MSHVRRTIRERQALNGLTWGAAAFVGGWLLVLLTLGPNPLGMQVADWKQAGWVFLNLHGVPVSGAAFDDSLVAGFQFFDFTQGNQQWVLLQYIPILVGLLGGVLVNVSMGWTRRFPHIATNSLFLPLGYVGTGLVVIVVTDARPGLSVLIGLFVLCGLGLAVGSLIADSLGVPVLAVTTIGGLLLLGIAVVAGIALILQTLLPLAILALIGTALGGTLVYVARSMPW